ncbi:DUF2721 domain-containing protein [Aquabacterium sp. A08]|uniref:DUF2721 domain-containing protein n=1 Tax=Aquabacterium sp. A08 TaxID=2718532 RepID=UPI00141EB721|nr:DUF2721 domain-containing protein [Aquabacterium sp. A08]NIC40116.1 DUF2721 domain-containing protein [Aquabacterium sp. A08]
MALFTDPSSVTHGIQLAVAPVFLLTAVSGMIAAVAGRLARIIDRARVLEERLQGQAERDAPALQELARLRLRGLLANSSIASLTLCAFLIGLTILLLFLGETTDFQSNRGAILSFLGGVLCFMLALACFLAETVLSTQIMNFGQGLRR